MLPGVLIPLLAITVPFIPREKVTTRVTFAMTVEDPRSTRPASTSIRSDFDTASSGDLEIAASLADSLEDILGSPASSGNEERSPIETSVNQAADGGLFIEGADSDLVSLHLTRFPEVESLTDLMAMAHPNMAVQMTLEETRFPIPLEEELADPGLNMSAGVYRLVLTATAYRDEFLYLEYTNARKLYVASEFEREREGAFPLAMKLYPVSQGSRRLKLALKPFPVCTELTGAILENRNIHLLVQQSLGEALEQRGFSVIEVSDETMLDFHPHRLKNMPAPPGRQYADLLVKTNCQWIR